MVPGTLEQEPLRVAFKQDKEINHEDVPICVLLMAAIPLDGVYFFRGDGRSDPIPGER